MAKCDSCVHFCICERYQATVDFDVDDGVCRYYEKEAVRCFECKKEGTEDCPMVYKVHLPRMLFANTKATDFCSYGERRTDG